MGYPKKLTLEPGMKFCSTSVGTDGGVFESALARLIIWGQVSHSKDKKAEYTHVGHIENSDGATWEARLYYGEYHIDDYIGSKVLIGISRDMTPEAYKKGMTHQYRRFPFKRTLYGLNGKLYPIVSLVLMVFKWLSALRGFSGKPVCSEAAFINEMFAGRPDIKEMINTYKNRTPDDMADAIKNWRVFEVVYEGIWPGMEHIRHLNSY